MSIKISGGSIKTLSGLATRPTPSKVRAAIFNIWQWKIRRSHWLDICSGSGAMSAEALVKGVGSVTAIEISRASCKLIQQNLEKICKPDQTFEIHCGDAVKILAKLIVKSNASQFDFIYFDPPYQSSLYEPVLEIIPALMSPAAVIAVEHACDRHLLLTSNLKAINQRIYGKTSVSFFSKYSNGQIT